MWLFNRDEAQSELSISGANQWAGLADFDDAGHLYDRGLLLPLCKISGLLMIRVGARKPLTVIVKQGYLPMMVPPSCVSPE
jgi:hypothetical protein